MIESDAARIARIQPLVLDGIAWYRYAEVCRALRVPNRRCYELVPRAHKRRHYAYRAGYRSIIELLIDRQGVEQLVIKFCRQPRGEIMDQLLAAP